jgi:hypothetical protein
MAKTNAPYQMVEVESYEPANTSGLHGKVHIRPCVGQGFPTTMHVECSKELSERYPPGTRFRITGSSSICGVQREHSGPEQFWAGTPIHRALQGLQSVDLAFGLTIAPLHFDRIPDRINVSVQGSGEPHDGR